MKPNSWKSRAFVALVAVLGLVIGSVDDSFARGGGGGGGRGGFSGGGKSFGGGASFRSSTPASSHRIAPTAPAPSRPAAAARAEPVKPGFKTAQPAPAPMKRTFDAAGAQANHEAASRQNFRAAQPPAQAAAARPYEYKHDTYVRNLRSDLAGEKWKNRQFRQDQAFGGYYNRSSAPIFAQPAYHDPFGNMFFWMWLMDRPRERDTWLYHHQGEVDPARLAEMKAKDTDLDRRLKALEASGVKRDSAYTPAELKDNKDLMYSDDVVKEAAKAEHSMSGLWLVLGGLLFLASFIYLVFIKRWNVGGHHVR